MSDTLAQAATQRPVTISKWTSSYRNATPSGQDGDREKPPPIRATTLRCRKTPYREAAFLAMDDFLFAALFLWMTPLLTALSSLVDATLSASAAAEASPESAAVLNLRIQVRISLLTALLRSVARAFVLMRLS
jgi:hypothetical protein